MLRKPVDFTVRCSDPQFKTAPAKYKIAAEWSGGDLTELKTFGFANDECLDSVYLAAVDRAAKIRLSEGESLGEMGIYLMDSRRHDYELQRQPELEARFLTAAPA